MVSDLVMPGMSGPELTHILRGSGVSAPALAIPGHSLEEDDEEAIGEAGFCDMIPRPFSATDLARAVRRL